MSSTVTNFSNNINVLYPVPGVDNDTQGFRDNFASIKNALQSAAQELTQLDLTAVKLDKENDYNYSGSIFRGVLKATGVAGTTNDRLATDTSVSFQLGGFHKIAVDGSVNISVSNWPTLENIYSTVRFEILNYNTSTGYVNFIQGSNTLKKEASLTLPHVLGTNTEVSHVFELSSADAGNTVFVKFIGTYTNV
jgi:hypothetical protein